MDLYRSDMIHIPVGNGKKTLSVFNNIPAILTTHRKAFRPGN